MCPPAREAPRTLFLLGFFTLFLELVLIRYLAGNIWNLGYFPNLVLMSAFVGMGAGFVFHGRIPEQRSPGLFALACAGLFGLALFVHLFRPAVPFLESWKGLVDGEMYFTASPDAQTTSASNAVFFVWFAAVAGIFALVSQRTAKVFRAFPPLTAYALDVGGSCAGILAFMAISWLQLPAWSWFLIAAPLVLGALEPAPARMLALAALCATAALAFHQDTLLFGRQKPKGLFSVHWSPYQKVEFQHSEDARWDICVNGIPHQYMKTAPELKDSVYGLIHAARRERKGLGPYKRVLIIGAGSGNDVASALAHGAEHVDAVEIDPAIAELGRKHHPCKPYDDPRVTLHVDDGRAFLTRATGKYDLVMFALTDSLVKVSAMAQLRLENYLFTVESARRAYELCTPTGDVLFYNYYRSRWLIDKIARVAYTATGRYPVVFAEKQHDFAAILVGPATAAAAPPDLDRNPIEVATDDWPFLYLVDRRVPEPYLWAMGLCAALIAGMLGLLRATHTRELAASGGRLPVAFLVMGIAFMLLETKSIIQFSLLFGTTWVNSSLVFLAVLVSVLAANAVAARLASGGRTLWVLYGLLMGSCMATLCYPLGNLLSVASVPARFLAASALTFGPIFFANLIYSLAFRDSAVPEHVFGWNLLGATLGGVLEYTSMSMGYTFLAWIVAVAYTVVFFLLKDAPQTAGRSSGGADA